MTQLLSDLLPYIAPILTGVAAWVAGRSKQRNDFIANLQASIDLLSEKNKTLLQEVITLRGDNAAMKSNQEEMQISLKHLRNENKELTEHVQELTELITANGLKIKRKKTVKKQQENNESNKTTFDLDTATITGSVQLGSTESSSAYRTNDTEG